MIVPGAELSIQIEDLTEQHITAYASLSWLEYGDSPVADPEHLRWKFLENPQGRSRAIHLYHGRELIGRLVAQPRTFLSAGAPAKAAYIVDLLVHPAYRGMPSLLKLLGGVNKLRAEFDLILVTPNAAGRLVWANFVRLHSRFDLDVWATPLVPARLLSRRLRLGVRLAAPIIDSVWRGVAATAKRIATLDSRVRFERAWPDSEELDALLAAAASSHCAAGRRDRSFVEWRFRSSPVVQYEVDFFRKRDQLVGYIASRRMVYEGYDVRFIVDVVATPAMTRRDWRAVRWEYFGFENKRSGAELIMTVGNMKCSPLSQFAKLPFISVPTRMLPQRVTVFADWWSQAAFDLDEESLNLTLADCDMV